MQSTTTGRGGLRGASRSAGWVLAIGVAFVLVAVLGALGAPSASGGTNAPAVVTFASVPSPTAVAVTSTELIVLSGASCSTVYSVASNGTVSPFATLVTTVSKCPQVAVAISPGLGNFPAGEVFVLQAGQLFEIPAGGSGSPVSPSMTLTNLTTAAMGLTFDTTGNFGYTLIATGGLHGAAVEIDAANQVQSIGTFGVAVEGPSVAPLSFGTAGGDLIAAQGNASTIDAMSPSGAVASFSHFGGTAESISFVPELACSFSTTGDSYFVADTGSNSVLAVPSTSFARVLGLGIVASESRGTAVLHTNGTTTRFLGISGAVEGAAYAACPVGVKQTVDLRPHGFNGTALNLIGYDPAVQVMIGADPTTAPSQIFLLNATTLGFVQNVSTGLDPAAVAYTPQTDTLFVANTGSNNLTVLNATTFAELGNISTGAGSAPVGVAYNSGNQKLYVANSGTDALDVFSLANNVFPNKNQVLHLGGEPVALVVDPRDGNTYVAGNVGGNGTVWDVHAFKVVHTLVVGLDAQAIAVNNGTGNLYVTVSGSNQLAIVAPGDSLKANVGIVGPVGVAFDPSNGLVFVDSSTGSMSVLRGTTVVAVYGFGAQPGPLIYDPASGIVYGAADVTIFGLDPRIIIGGVG